MWTDRSGRPAPLRIDLRGKDTKALAEGFTTEVGIGQYGVTVLDHANGMATFAAGGKRAQAHFVREVSRRGERVYAEQLTQSDIGLTQAQIDELNWTLSQVPSARLANGWDAAGKTGTWQVAKSTTRNAHTWMVGYTGALAAAVWLGTTDGRPLRTTNGRYDVLGATHAAPIWRQFMVGATAAMGLDPKGHAFRTPKLAPSQSPVPGSTNKPTTAVVRPTAAPKPARGMAYPGVLPGTRGARRRPRIPNSVRWLSVPHGRSAGGLHPDDAGAFDLDGDFLQAPRGRPVEE
jgi:membrane peptidoglycan carboxypeptidase